MNAKTAPGFVMPAKLFRTCLVLTLVASFLSVFVEPAAAQRAPSEASFRIGDMFELRIAGVPPNDVGMVSKNYSVNDDGTVNLPYIGRIRAAGMTPATLQSAVEAAYKNAEIYTNPTITVITQASARFINIGGEIRSPGRVPHTPDMTLLTAISAAGGPSEYANQKRVQLSRGAEVFVVDLRKIREDPRQDIPLLPGDSIHIPRSFW